jgi:hypothetical protein
VFRCRRNRARRSETRDRGSLPDANHGYHDRLPETRLVLGLHGARNGPGPFNGFVRTIEDAKAEFAAAGGAWLKAAGLSEDAPTAQRKDSDSGSA